jgi:hypothetical protein
VPLLRPRAGQTRSRLESLLSARHGIRPGPTHPRGCSVCSSDQRRAMQMRQTHTGGRSHSARAVRVPRCVWPVVHSCRSGRRPRSGGASATARIDRRPEQTFTRPSLFSAKTRFHVASRSPASSRGSRKRSTNLTCSCAAVSQNSDDGTRITRASDSSSDRRTSFPLLADAVTVRKRSDLSSRPCPTRTSLR